MLAQKWNGFVNVARLYSRILIVIQLLNINPDTAKEIQFPASMSAANGTSWVNFELDTRPNLHLQMKVHHHRIENIKMFTLTSTNLIAKENSTSNVKVKDIFWLKDFGFAHAQKQEKILRLIDWLIDWNSEIVYRHRQNRTTDTQSWA